MPIDDKEYTRIWSQWLKTEDGKSYRAGWGDYVSLLQAERGRVWCYERMIERMESELIQLRAHNAELSAGLIVGTTYNSGGTHKLVLWQHPIPATGARLRGDGDTED